MTKFDLAKEHLCGIEQEIKGIRNSLKILLHQGIITKNTYDEFGWPLGKIRTLSDAVVKIIDEDIAE